MKKIAQGLPLKKYIGNKHKDGGIMVNALGNKTKDVNKAVAEVEGGEYNFRYNPNNPKDNYILSEQLGIAGIAKQADRFKGNNRIDYNTRTNLLNKSMKLNEMLRVQQEQQQPMQMALGGGLNNNLFDKQPPKQKDSDFRKTYQSTPMNVVKMFDPTGISSYPDVAYSIDDYNKGKGSKSDIALNVLGALPIIGKAKGLITLAKGTSKTKKGLNTITKLGDLAGDIERFPLQTAKDLTNNATKPIAKLVNKSATNLLNFNDVIRNTIVPPLNPKRIPTKSATKSDMINAGTSLVNISNLGSDINSVSKKQFGGKLKKYKPGGPLPYDGTNPMDDVSMQNSYRAVSTPGNEITNTPIQPTAPLLSASQKFELPTKVQSVNPKVNADTKTLDVSKEMEQASSPVKQKKNNFKGALSAVSGAVSALGPIGQGVGAALQLAPYAIDLGKAMFDKTSVQDLQTQGSAMRLPNTTYAKHGGKLNVKPLPKFEDGTNINKKPITTDPILQTIINNLPPQESQYGLRDFAGVTPTGVAKVASDNIEREREYDRTIGIPNALRSFYSNKGLTPNYGNNGTNNLKNPLDVVEPPKQKDKLSEMLKSGLMLKGSAMAGSLFSALQPAQKETLRLPDFGRADDAMSRATAFSMNPALNEVEQARGKSQESIRNMATTAGQLTSNLQSVNQRAGQQAAGLRVQEQQIMNQLAAQKAGYETQKASAIQQELARFDENTLMNKAATQDAKVAFVENINNLGTEIMKQGNEQDIADQQDKLAVQNAKLKIIQSAFENPDIISGANLEKMLKMIQEGDYTNMPKLFGQPSETRRVLKKDDSSKKQ